MTQKNAEQMATEMTDFLNSFNDRERAQEFAQAMSYQHRTLQQAFTRLCLKWIEFVASDNYLTDGRNEASKETAQKLLAGYEDEFGLKPSERLPLV